MDFSVTLSGVPAGNEASNDSPCPMQHTEDNTSIVLVDASIEGIEDGEATGEAHGGESITNVIDKMAFVDYLKSPIITLLVGPPNQEIALTAHQLFLSRSPFFRNIFTTSHTHSITLPDDDLDAIGCFLQFLYTGEYFPRIVKNSSGEENLESEPGTYEIDEDGSKLLKHARVYTLAEKLGVQELKHLAHAKIHRINSTAKGELAYARYVYASTPREDTTIRNPIAYFWAHRSHILRHEAEEEFRRMILEFPQFAYDILSMVLDQKEKSSRDKGKEDKEEGDGKGTERVKSGRKRPRLSTFS